MKILKQFAGGNEDQPKTEKKKNMEGYKEEIDQKRNSPRFHGLSDSEILKILLKDKAKRHPQPQAVPQDQPKEGGKEGGRKLSPKEGGRKLPSKEGGRKYVKK